MKAELTLIPRLTIHPDSICSYYMPEWSPAKPDKSNQSSELDFYKSLIGNFGGKENKTQGNVSTHAKRKIKKAVTYLLATATDKKITSQYSGRKFNFKIAFITLTLPSKQIHSDNEIKSKLLNSFLIEITKIYQVKNYVWRAEKQRNGNIHFHILIDKFIDWNELRNRWNRIVNKLGYVDRYRNDQKKYHKKGFKLKKELLPTWSKEKQYEAYKRGAACHWSSPNSTDIHSLKKIFNVKNYILKYVTKSVLQHIEFSKKIQNLKKEIQKIDNKKKKRKLIRRLEKKNKKLKRFEKKEIVTGRLWSCNTNLSDIKGYQSDVDSKLQKEVEEVIKNSDCHSYKEKYFTIYYINYQALPGIGGKKLYELFCQYLLEKFNFNTQLFIN